MYVAMMIFCFANNKMYFGSLVKQGLHSQYCHHQPGFLENAVIIVVKADAPPSKRGVYDRTQPGEDEHDHNGRNDCVDVEKLYVTALLSVGAVFVYALGNIDISTGKQVGLYATLMVTLQQQTGSLIWGILLSLAIAVVIAIIK